MDTLQASDLYPLPAAKTQLLYRRATDGGRACTAGSDAVASGCIGVAEIESPTSELFDVSTAGFQCSQTPYV